MFQHEEAIAVLARVVAAPTVLAGVARGTGHCCHVASRDWCATLTFCLLPGALVLPLHSGQLRSSSDSHVPALTIRDVFDCRSDRSSAATRRPTREGGGSYAPRHNRARAASGCRCGSDRCRRSSDLAISSKWRHDEWASDDERLGCTIEQDHARPEELDKGVVPYDSENIMIFA